MLVFCVQLLKADMRTHKAVGLSRPQAEELLKAAGMVKGYFLVRSGRGGTVVVSLVHDGGIGHFNIEAKGMVGISEIKLFVRSVFLACCVTCILRYNNSL